MITNSNSNVILNVTYSHRKKLDIFKKKYALDEKKNGSFIQSHKSVIK